MLDLLRIKMDNSENNKEAICQQLQKGQISVISYGKLKMKITPQEIIGLLGSEVVIPKGK